MIDFIKHFTVVASFCSLGASAFLKACTEVYWESQIFRQEEISIGTESVTAEVQAWFVSIRIVTQVFIHRSLIVEFSGSIVPHTFRTSTNTYVVALCRSCTVKYLIIPIYVRIEHGVYSAQLSGYWFAIHLNIIVAVPWVNSIVTQSFFKQYNRLIWVQVSISTCRTLNLPVSSQAHFRFLFLTTLSSN